MKTPKAKPNKHTELTAASFKRLAKELRAEAGNFKLGSFDSVIGRTLHIVAAHLDAEADRLRKMR